MADLVVVPASVISGSGGSFGSGTAKVVILAGQSIYLDSATSKYDLADNDGAAGTSTVSGIALHAAAVNQPIKFRSSGDINPGAAVTVGELYVLSSTPGGICPIADLGVGDKLSILGVATTTSNISLDIRNTGVTKA
jgi:hypothetical protein